MVKDIFQESVCVRQWQGDPLQKDKDNVLTTISAVPHTDFLIKVSTGKIFDPSTGEPLSFSLPGETVALFLDITKSNQPSFNEAAKMLKKLYHGEMSLLWTGNSTNEIELVLIKGFEVYHPK